VSREVQNLIPEIGQDVIRKGFIKANSVKYDASIQGLFDYKTRYGLHIPIITTGPTIISDVGSYYAVDVDATITVDSAFTLTIIKYDIWGNRDYTYNGTADLTEDGDGSLTETTITFSQGRATSATGKYTGGSAVTLVITATDDGDSTLTGSDTATVVLNPYQLSYTLSTRATHLIHSRTLVNGTSVWNSKLWFISSQADIDVELLGDSQDIEVLSIDTNGDGTLEATISENDLYLGMCITEMGGDLYVGSGIGGSLWKSSNGTDWSDDDTLGTVIYCLYKHGAKYYAGTGYGGVVYESSDLSSWNVSYGTGDIAAVRMVTFNSKLYVGTSSGQDVLGGGYGVFEYDSGWSDVYSGSLTQIFGMAVFDGKLYIGEHDESSATGGIVRSSSDGSSFATVLSTNQDFPYCMCVDGSTLYVGCADGIIYYTTNGTDWSNAESPTSEDIFAISVFNSLLYITTQNKVYAFEAP